MGAILQFCTFYMKQSHTGSKAIKKDFVNALSEFSKALTLSSVEKRTEIKKIILQIESEIESQELRELIENLWNKFFEAEGSGEEKEAKTKLTEIAAPLEKCVNHELLKNEYKKWQDMYDYQKIVYQLHEKAHALKTDGFQLKDLNKLNAASDIFDISKDTLRIAAKIDKRFEHELEVVKKPVNEISELIKNIEKELKDNEPNEDNHQN